MTTPGDSPRLGRLAIVVASLAVGWTALAVAIPFLRLWYPFELEWMGGGFGDHVGRVLDGQPLYVEPSADWTPYLYTPLYVWLSAGLSRVIGEGLPTLRLVSILASIANLALMFAIVHRKTASRLAALITIGVWSGCYFLVETWYDSERVDSTFLTFVLATVLVLDRCRGAWGAIVAAALLVCGYMTKQTALMLAPPLAVMVGVRAPRLGAIFAGAFALLWLAVTRTMDALSDGWFHFYTWQLPRDHEFKLEYLWNFWTTDSRTVWPTFCLALWVFTRGFSLRGVKATLADGALWSGLLLAGLASRMHTGGAVNVLMPTWLGCAVVCGLSWSAAAVAAARIEARLVRALVLMQLALFAIKFSNSDQPFLPKVQLLDPSIYLPTTADAAVGERLVNMLRETEGDVVVPFHGYLARMAGKRGSAHSMAVIDIRGKNAGDRGPKLMADFFNLPRSRGAELIVLDDNLEGLTAFFEPGYAFDTHLAQDRQPTFMPVIGLKARPVVVFRRVK
ncbi:MAG: glycosyltransferase family 39 protein [Planctomycetota bacterium]